MADMTSDTAAPAPPVLKTELRGADGFAQFRAMIAEICEASALGPEDEFQLTTTTLHLGSAVAIDATVTPVCYDRSPEYVARSRIDHYQLAIYLCGGCEYTGGRRTVSVRTGDVFVVDMAGANRTRVQRAPDGADARVLTFVLPRPLLAPLLAAPDAVQGAVIRHETAVGSLAKAQMLALCEEPGLAADVDDALGELVHLVARAMGPAAGLVEGPGPATRPALLSRVKHYIDEHLSGSELGTEHLCRQFDLSRATLYRLFDPEGGLAGYIRGRRLMRAYTMLASAGLQHVRILDIALESQFASDATFTRAFHRRFGLTPGEVRARAAASRSDPGAREGGDDPGFQSSRWVRELRRDPQQEE